MSTTQSTSHHLQRRNLRLAVKLTIIAVCMLLFTPVLWYTGGILCDWAGIGINPGSDGPRSEIRMISGDEVVESP
ncbi:MAG: hypothetical protein EA401_12020 [Planctomycetota bacterium]|nr:MAG: hypothetical protein EA401_12020 [Planctomycetota bacterium]